MPSRHRHWFIMILIWPAILSNVLVVWLIAKLFKDNRCIIFCNITFFCKNMGCLFLWFILNRLSTIISCLSWPSISIIAWENASNSHDHQFSAFHTLPCRIICLAHHCGNSIMVNALGDCFTTVLRALQNILLEFVYWRNHTFYENFKPCFGHTYKVLAWNSVHKCDFWHCIFSLD